MSLFNELKRRNVFKVVIAYMVMAWLVLQVADVILNNITAPDWIFHVLLLFVAIGLPFAVFFAYDKFVLDSGRDLPLSASQPAKGGCQPRVAS